MTRSNGDQIGEVANLGSLPRDQLVSLWTKAHGCPPPKGIRHELLVRSAAWHLQAKKQGGLSPATRRALKAAVTRVEAEMLARLGNKLIVAQSRDACAPETGTRDAPGVAAGTSGDHVEPASTIKPRSSARIPAPGARLLRDWNGRTYVVDVIENGFVFEAKVFKSLTAIARQITGAHWSGPRFFGL